MLASGASAVTLKDLPRGAHPGECFSHRSTPAVYRTDHIPIPQPPVEGWRDIPAIYNTVTRQELVTPARVDHETIPAVMGVRIHWVEHHGPDQVVSSPPVYRWIERQVMISPAHLEWRRGEASGGYGGGGAAGYGGQISVRPTGDVMCRVRVPARYEIRRVRVLVASGRTCVVKGPTRRERVVEHIVVRPEHVVDHPVAAVYRTVTDRVMVRGPRKERITTAQPPRYEDRRVLVTPAHTDWIRIHCAREQAAYGPGPQSSYDGLAGAPQPAPAYHAPDPNQH